MPTTIRDQILEAMLARLQTVNPSAKRQYIRILDTDLPAACLWDGPETGGNVVCGKQSYSLTVGIAMGARLAVADNASVVANEMLGQLLVAMIGTDPTLSGLADAVKYQTSVPNYPEPGGDFVVGIEAAFAVEYKTVLGNPYLS